MDEQSFDNVMESSEVVDLQGQTANEDGPSLTNPVKEKKTPQQLAIAIRKHLKGNKNVVEIMAIENCTRMQYRYALRLLGKFPGGNEEAFARFNFAMQARLDNVDRAIDAATRMGEFHSISSLTRTAAYIQLEIMNMAMKLGVLYKAPEKLEVTDRKRFDVGFGDEVEATKPMWPGGSDKVQ
jgi:hypothetical protein